MNAAELQKIERWPEILVSIATVWAVNRGIVAKADVDKAFAEGSGPTGQIAEITDEHVAFTIDILGNVYPVHFRMPVAEVLLNHHFNCREQDDGNK